MVVVVQLAVAVHRPIKPCYRNHQVQFKGKIRVTEQGEMIRFKFGMQGIALRNLVLFKSFVGNVAKFYCKFYWI